MHELATLANNAKSANYRGFQKLVIMPDDDISQMSSNECYFSRRRMKYMVPKRPSHGCTTLAVHIGVPVDLNIVTFTFLAVSGNLLGFADCCAPSIFGDRWSLLYGESADPGCCPLRGITFGVSQLVQPLVDSYTDKLKKQHMWIPAFSLSRNGVSENS